MRSRLETGRERVLPALEEQAARSTVILAGPNLAAVSGVSTHLNQLLKSSLSEVVNFKHFQVGSEGKAETPLRALFRYVVSPFQLLRCIMQNDVDLVHLNTSLEPKAFWRDVAYLVVAKLMSKKVILQVHGGTLPKEFLGRGHLAQAFLRRLLNMPDAIVLLALIEEDAYEEFLGEGAISVIANAIDFSEYALLPAKPFAGSSIRAVYVGRLALDKGILEALQAIKLLRDAGITNVTFDIAGSGPAENVIREFIHTEKLGASVRMVGPIFGAEKLRFWADAELFVFPTFHREGLPYAVLESLASGTPLITSAVGAIPDVITDGVQGRIVAPKAPAELAETMNALINDREQLRRMSAAGRARARDEYSVERMARQFQDLYARILA